MAGVAPGPVGRVERARDEPPRCESVLAPRVRRNDAVVGATTHTVRHPFDERVVVGWCPPTIDLEPPKGGAKGVVGVRWHRRQVLLKMDSVVRPRPRRVRIAAMRDQQIEPPAALAFQIVELSDSNLVRAAS